MQKNMFIKFSMEYYISHAVITKTFVKFLLIAYNPFILMHGLWSEKANLQFCFLFWFISHI